MGSRKVSSPLGRVAQYCRRLDTDASNAFRWSVPATQSG
jgi:hypothetical protein